MRAPASRAPGIHEHTKRTPHPAHCTHTPQAGGSQEVKLSRRRRLQGHQPRPCRQNPDQTTESPRQPQKLNEPYQPSVLPPFCSPPGRPHRSQTGGTSNCAPPSTPAPRPAPFELELELIQSHMAQKPVLRDEVGCACVAREVSVEPLLVGADPPPHCPGVPADEVEVARLFAQGLVGRGPGAFDGLDALMTGVSPDAGPVAFDEVELGVILWEGDAEVASRDDELV